MNAQSAYTPIVSLPCYTEGPVIDQNGNLFFTCPSAGDIIKVDAYGNAVTWAKRSRPNGQIILESGEHLVCDSDTASLCRFDTNGRLKSIDIQDACAGYRFTTPNDLVVDESSGCYFTDSVRHCGAVYYSHPSGMQHRVLYDLDYPNGIALSADERTLFIAESYRNRILRVPLSAPGVAAGDPQVHCALPGHGSGNAYDNLPDGIKLDRHEHLWIAHYGMGRIHVINPTGKLVRSLDAVFRCCSNIYLTGHGCIVTGGETESGPGGVHMIIAKK